MNGIQKIMLLVLTFAGLSLLLADWFTTGGTMGFFLLLFVGCMTILRWRVPKLGATSLIDVLVFVIFSPMHLALAIFPAMYHGMYIGAFAIIYVTLMVDTTYGIFAILCGIIGLFLRFWQNEYTDRLQKRDVDAARYYQLEATQNLIQSSIAKIEKLTAISERTRISQEIHDNAGHEIVAALMSLQTARSLLCDTDDDILELFDSALLRLESGMDKIRESVHNLSSITTLGIETLKETCENFPKDVSFQSFGETRHVPMYVWDVLESCLNEALTNTAKHASPTFINVEIDTTPHIVRLCIENDGGSANEVKAGVGLRNLRHRLIASGGSLSITKGATFRLVCVLPIAYDSSF